MLKMETDFIKLEFDDKLNDITGGIINDILDKMLSYSGIPETHFSPVKETEKDLDSNDGIIPEEPEEIDVRKVRLPRCSSDLTCPSCKQSFLMKTESDDILFKNYNDNKLYNLGKMQLPQLPKSETAKYKKMQSIYSDCIALCKSKQYDVSILISDSKDILTCPFCGEKITVKDMTDYVLREGTNEKCYICGSETEFVIKDGCTKKRCLKNECKL